VTNFQEIKLSKALSFTLRSMPRGKSYEHPIANSCNLPFSHVTVDTNLDCFLCQCDGWLPVPVGKVFDFETLEDVWSSPTARMLQTNIDEKKYTWCAVNHCGVTAKDVRNYAPHTLYINLDDSCNLACPSCRRELRMLEQGPEFENKTRGLAHILKWLEKFEHPIMISLGGTGDALASQLCRDFIKKYRHKVTQTFRITTNGLLLRKVIENSSIRPAISIFSVSVDAGTQEVYEKVRRPGKWSVLMENLEWLANNRQKSQVNLNFVLQKTNFQDLPAFVNLCERFNFVGAVTKLNDWGTWNSTPVSNPDSWTLEHGTYMDHDVCNPEHADFAEFVKIYNQVKEQKHKFINFAPYFLKI
jgi:molybdenum cofactor biosynthesis enzyme MoaA